MKLVLAITGASGAIYGVRFLEELKKKGVEVHLILTKYAKATLLVETGRSPEEVSKLADFTYGEDEMAAPFSSGSFRHDGVAIIPCSMKTLGLIANGLEVNLVSRAAGVALKERRSLLLVVREMPLSIPHIKNMYKAALAGATIMPACPSFYSRPKTIDDLVNTVVGRALEFFGLEHNLYKRWEGI